MNICSALNNTGITDVWDMIMKYHEMAMANGYFMKRRQEQELKIFYESIGERLKGNFYNDPVVKSNLESYKASILEGKISSYQAGNALLDDYYTSIRENTGK